MCQIGADLLILANHTYTPPVALANILPRAHESLIRMHYVGSNKESIFFFSDFIENLVDTILVIFGGLLPSTNHTADLGKRRLTLSSREATSGTVDEANKPKSS